MVRSLLEFCSPLWNPTKISDTQEAESVQRTFTSRIAALVARTLITGNVYKNSLLCHSNDEEKDSS